MRFPSYRSFFQRISTLLGPSSTIAMTVREKVLRVVQRHGRARVKRWLKAVTAIVVVLAVGKHVHRTWRQFRESGQTLHIEPAWIALAIVLYLVGLCACGAYFRAVLQASASPVRAFPAIRAYLISHLGKYVPGKAMVVLMRVGLVTSNGVLATTAAFATFYETLVMMAAGGLVATAGFLIVPIERWAMVLGLLLALALLIVVEPNVFPRLSKFVVLPFGGVDSQTLPRFTHGLLAKGLLWTCVAWILLGLSQVAVIRALTPSGVVVELWPLVIASVALAMVAGFAVPLLPGGLGVREGMLMATLEPAVGRETAILAALALRLTWVLAELIAAALLALARPTFDRSPPS
jgi:uncharacterized membrane protein YbhN (UPF0104 family)